MFEPSFKSRIKSEKPVSVFFTTKVALAICAYNSICLLHNSESDKSLKDFPVDDKQIEEAHAEFLGAIAGDLKDNIRVLEDSRIELCSDSEIDGDGSIAVRITYSSLIHVVNALLYIRDHPQSQVFYNKDDLNAIIDTISSCIQSLEYSFNEME